MTHDSKELLELASNLELMRPNAHGRIVLALEKSQCKEIVDALRAVSAPQPGMRAEGEVAPIGEDTPYWRTLRAALVLPVEEQHAIAKDLAANCGYELTGDAYAAPPKPAPDAMREATIIRVSKRLAQMADNIGGMHAPELERLSRALSAPVPPPDGARNCVACNKPWIDGCWGGSLPDFSRCANLTAPPSDDVRSALADNFGRKIEAAWDIEPTPFNRADVAVRIVNAALRSAPVSTPAETPDFETAALALGFQKRQQDGKWWHPNQQHFVKHHDTAADIFDWYFYKHWGEQIAAAPAVGVTREGIIATVETAMRDTWNEICSDTQCHPTDIEQHRGKILSFEPQHWARFAGETVADKLGSPAPDATVSEPFESPEFNRSAREGWMRCGVYHIDIDFEGRASEQEAINRRWPLSSPQHVGRDAAVSARDAVIEEFQRAQAWLDTLDGVSLPSRDVLIAWYAERPSLRSAIRSLTGAKS